MSSRATTARAGASGALQAVVDFRDFNLDLAKRVTYSRADIQKFWNKTWKSWRLRQIFLIRPHKVILNFLRDAELILLFAVALLRAEPDS